MKQIFDRIAAPLAGLVGVLATALPVRAATDCSDPNYNLLPGDINVVPLDPKICEAIGPGLSTLTVTLFNAMALAIVLYLGYKLITIGISALTAFNGGGKGPKDEKTGLPSDIKINEGNIIRGTVISIAQVLVIGVLGYMLTIAAPNLLFGAARGVVEGFAAEGSRFNWLNFAGPFKGLAATAQNFLSIAVVLYGAFLSSKAWIGYLGNSSYAQAGSDGMKMDNLRQAVIRTASIAFVTVLAFFAITFGPNLFGDLIFGIGDQLDGNLLP
jgi:hypothetical protein